MHPTETGGYLENHPTAHWPLVRINLIYDSLNESFGTGNFEVVSSDKSVEAGVLVTRLIYSLLNADKFFLRDAQGNDLLKIIGFGRPAPQDREDLLFKTKLFRKLKFIEKVFNTEFILPSRPLTGEEAHNIEIVFRGITEGEFTSRTGDITFHDYTSSLNELNGPPFAENGPIAHTFNDQEFSIFGRRIQVGPMTIRIPRAGIADPRDLDPLLNGEKQAINLRLIVFDFQIIYRFERYAGRPQHIRERKLKQFKMNLSREEPTELVGLVDDWLITEATAERARQIITGWLQYHSFPDRYCPQEPIIEENRWRVPIWITYPKGRGGWVQDAFVDLKTGAVTVPVSVEELRSLGKSVATELLRAS